MVDAPHPVPAPALPLQNPRTPPCLPLGIVLCDDHRQPRLTRPRPIEPLSRESPPRHLAPVLAHCDSLPRRNRNSYGLSVPKASSGCQPAPRRTVRARRAHARGGLKNSGNVRFPASTSCFLGIGWPLPPKSLLPDL